MVIFFCCFTLTESFYQTQRKVSTYLLIHYDVTRYDYTLNNNPWGIGLGCQTFFNNKSKFKPTAELTGDIYLEDDKVLKLNLDGSVSRKDNSVRSMVNLFVGSSFQPTQNVYLSIVAGPSFISGQTLLDIKPSVGFYFKKWTGKVSYVNIYNRTEVAKEDFGSLSLAIGLRIF